MVDVARSSTMEQIVVTGTRSTISQSQSPVSIDVISAVQLQKLSHGTLAGALNYIPGVVAKRNAKDGYTVQMQGFDENHVLILLDSQPLISPTGSAVDLDQIGVVDIERIEVLRGAASVLYGSSAMGGVINIISRKQSKDHLKVKYQSSSYTNNNIDSADVGQQLQLDASQNILGWQSSLSLQKIDDPGFDYDTKTVSQSAPSTDKHFVNLRLSKQFEDSLELSLKARYFSDDKQKQRYVIPGQAGEISYLSQVEQWQYDLGLNQGEFWRVQGRYLNHQETSGDSNSLRDADIKLAEIDSQYLWNISEIELVSGFVLHRDELYQVKQASEEGTSGTVEIDDKARDSIEGYSQLSWQIADHEVLAGIRAQHDSEFGWHSAARVNVLFSFVETQQQQWQLRMGVGQSYRVPTLKERFYIFDHSNLGYMVLGNDQLKPETAVSTNLEATYLNQLNSSKQQLSLSVNAHYARAKDFIETVTDVDASAASGLLISRYSNVEQAVMKGLDLSAKLSLGKVNYQLSYSYLHATDHSGEHLSDRPTHQIKANLDWQFPFDIHGLIYLVYENGSYPTEQQVGVEKDAWSSLNLSLSQSLNKNWHWIAGVDNVFDNHQNTDAIAAGLLDVRPLSSRRVFAGISYQFY
ncbi:iron complex outermembrane recepter protein [Paraglaciecola arctica BSs20135]|uniref:Iron complex outermembrane recepter protein n=2 Tax=Paraglaciecola TaxID=1621534 RepID=K6XN91_9ALTE|nr:iron complex outermembrane recepter protein [Paraglaciecola arctica BSs20135]